MTTQEKGTHASTAPALLANYVSREQLAAELHVTKRTLDRWAWHRNGPKSVRIGARCYYDRREVLAWIESKK